LLWLAPAMRSKYLGAGSYRLARRNVLVEFISTAKETLIRQQRRDSIAVVVSRVLLYKKR
jgi:hypothetical protein